MSLVGPDGRPLQTSPQEKFIAGLRQLHERQDATFQQVIHLGIFVEYLVDRLEAKGFDFEMEGFPEFADRKYREIQQRTVEALKEQGRVVQAEDLDGRDIAEVAGINLDG